MKPEFDKEIDSLLRQSAGATAWGPRSVDAASAAAPSVAHLDADELSAYAENALPAAARARYVSHLADCERCRAVVIDLTRAAGIAARLEADVPVRAEESVGERARRSWFASFGELFSVRVLRYVAPVLAVALVGIVAYVALRRPEPVHESAATQNRQESANTSAARTSDSSANTRTETANTTNTNASTNNSNLPATQTPEQVAGLNGENRAANPSVVAEAPVGQHGNNNFSVDGNQPPVAQTSGQTAGGLAGVTVPKVEGPNTQAASGGAAANAARDEMVAKAEAPPPPAPKEVARVDASTSLSQPPVRQDEESNRAGAQTRMQEPQRAEGARSESRAVGSTSSNSNLQNSEITTVMPSARGPNSPARRARSSGVKRESETASETRREKDRDAGGEETRAAGHRFRRDGGAWVDVEYKPSMSMTGVRRNTEAYRALIADIPELGRVAEQLGGELIIVVKGRAYRIH